MRDNKFLIALKEELAVETQGFGCLIIKCLVLSVIIFFSFIYSPLVYVALGLSAIFISFEKGLVKLYYLVFLLPFYNVLRFNTDQLFLSAYLLLFTVILLSIRFIIDICKKRKQIDLGFTILLLCFLLYILLPIGPYDLMSMLTVLACVSICYLVYNYKDEINLKELVVILFLGFVVSCLFEPFRAVFPRLEEFLPNFASFANHVRFAGLQRDPNYFALEILLLLSSSSLLYIKNKINFTFYLILLMCTIWGVMSTSKAFLIAYFIWCLLFIIGTLLCKTNLKKKLIVLFVFGLTLVVSLLICLPYTKALFQRFWSSVISNFQIVKVKSLCNFFSMNILHENYGIDISDISTGRFYIWKQYVLFLFSQPVKFLFGIGVGGSYLTIDEVADVAVHNTFLQSIYFLGLFGTFLLLSIFIYLFVKHLNKKSISFANFIPFLTILVMTSSLDNLMSYRTFLLIIFISYTFNLKKGETVNNYYKDGSKIKNMDCNEKISLIVPIYKVEKYLNKCIESLLNQTHKNLEIILVDDGSPDNCPQICDEWAKKDSRIKVIHKTNGGVSSARNAGLDVATGEYIQFVDSDDFLELNACEKLLNEITTRQADLVTCNMRLINFNLKQPNLQVFHTDNQVEYLKTLYKVNLFNSPVNKIYKKELIKAKFIEGQKYSEDFLFNCEYIKNCQCMCYINDSLYNYVATPESSVNSYSALCFPNQCRVIDYIEHQLKPYFKNEEAFLNYLKAEFLLSTFKGVVTTKQLNRNEKLKIINEYMGNRYFKENVVYAKGLKRKVQLFCLKFKLINLLKRIYSIKH